MKKLFLLIIVVFSLLILVSCESNIDKINSSNQDFDLVPSGDDSSKNLDDVVIDDLNSTFIESSLDKSDNSVLNNKIMDKDIVNDSIPINDSDNNFDEDPVDSKIINNDSDDEDNDDKKTQEVSDSDIIKTLKKNFSGKTVDIISTSYANNMGSASRTMIHLCSNGQVAYEDISSSSYDSYDTSIHGSSEGLEIGVWDIIEEEEIVGLILQFEDGLISYIIDYDPYDNRFYLDETRVYLVENNYCD